MTEGLNFVRRIRTSPYINRVNALGVTGYSVYNHMLLPKSFGMSVEEAYWHLHEHVQIWDVSVERQVEIKGPDAARLVQWITPRDISRARPGRCYYIPVVDNTGGMLNDPVLIPLAEDRFWLSIADSDLLLYIKGLAIGADLDVDVEEPDVNPLAVQGPKADDVMADLFGDELRKLKFFHSTYINVQGSKQLVTRSGYSSMAGFEIYLDDSHLAETLWDMIWEAGQRHNIKPGGPNLIDKIEAGLLGYGNEITRENNPLELGYDKFCTLDGSIDCIGLKALRRIEKTGPARMIRGIIFDGAPCPTCSKPWRVMSEEMQIGMITSAAWSPRFKANIGLALMDRGYWDIGKSAVVELPDGDIASGKVTALPFDLSA